MTDTRHRAQAREDPERILVVGSVNLDLSLSVGRHPSPGETVPGGSSSRSPGGKGANQAVAAARLGGDVALAARVGADDTAEQALALLRDCGVDLSWTSADPRRETGLAVITVDRSGENSIVVIPGANGSWSVRDVAGLTQALGRSGILVCQGEIPAPVLDALGAAARAQGVRFLLNLAPVVEVAPCTLRAADPLVVNEYEARLALRALGCGDSGVDDAAVVRALRGAGVPSVVMTRGAAGALLSGPGAEAAVPSPRVVAKDTTGAGDAFVGALAVGLARGEGLEEASRLAVRVGAAAVRSKGAQASYPWAGEALPEV
jgi:ribokinase